MCEGSPTAVGDTVEDNIYSEVVIGSAVQVVDTCDDVGAGNVSRLQRQFSNRRWTTYVQTELAGNSTHR